MDTGRQSPESDRELVRRMLAGDGGAFERFFDAAYPALYRFAVARLGGNRDGAADVAQAVICQAIRKLGTYRGEAPLLAWLYTFARHEVYRCVRRDGGRQPVDLSEDDPEISAALESLRASSGGDLDTELDRHKVAAFVQRVLDHLPTHYANVLEWKYIDELPVQEIGGRLGISVKAAESLLTRARLAFREAFQTMSPLRADGTGS
jgi:RNA polymerase sigma-70 factor, ECF subfamily